MRFETRIAVYKKGEDTVYCPEVRVVRKIFGKEFSWCGWEDFTDLNTNIDFCGTFFRACNINEEEGLEYDLASIEFAKLVIDCFYRGLEEKEKAKMVPTLIDIIEYP